MPIPDLNQSVSKLLSIYRHEFLNYLQVVGGMVQLNKTDKLLDYIKKASEEIQQFGRLSACGDPRLSLILYESLFQDTDITVALQAHGTLVALPEQVVESMATLISEIRHQIVSNDIPALTIIISGEEETPMFGVHVPSAEDMLWQQIIATTESLGFISTFNAEEKTLLIFLDKVQIKEER